MGNEA